MNINGIHGTRFSAILPTDLSEIGFVVKTHFNLPSEWMPQYAPNLAGIDQEIEQVIRSLCCGDTAIFTAKDMHEAIVGFSWVERTEQEDCDVCLSRSLWVAQHCRRCGLGTTLKDMAKEWAANLGIEKLISRNSPLNVAAVELNTKLGYSIKELVMEMEINDSED